MLQNIYKIFGVLCLAGFLIITPHIFAEADTEVNTDSSKANKGFITKEEQKIIINKLNNQRTPQKHRQINSTQKIPSSYIQVEPIVILVKSIVGEEDNNRYAVIEFEGEEMTVRKDQIVPGKFKVVDIFPDRMVVYSNKEQRRHTFKLIKEETESSTKQ